MLKNHKKNLATRSEPLNLRKEDNHLFNSEYKKILPSSNARVIKNIYLEKSRLKKYQYFRVHVKEQRMNPISLKIKIKYFFLDLKELLFNKNSSKPLIIDKASWVIDSRSNQYFHWLTDAMQRIDVVKEYVQDYPIILTENFKNNSFVKESLELLDIKPIYLKHDGNYLIKEMILSERVTPAGNYKKEIIKSVSEEFLNLSPRPNNKKTYKYIWISRQNTGKRKIENFDEIEKILNKYSFTILQFENLSFSEQIRIVNNCEILGGVHGAGLVNMLFLNKKAKIIELRGKNDSKNNCFFTLASDLELDYYYHLSETISEDYYSTNHVVNPYLFEKFIKELMADIVTNT
jgi:capsular polysaccharide biosynthesis protein